MKHYRLIAFDMDGTLLDNQKELMTDTILAIKRAVKHGKHVAVCTGRSIAELRDFFPTIPEIQFHICSSGGMIYDSVKDEVLFKTTIESALMRQIMEISKQEDIMLQISTKEMIIEEKYLTVLGLYGMEQFTKSYQKITYRVEDAYAFLEANMNEIVKINLYHRDVEARERTMAKLKDVPVAKVYSEKTSIECTPLGVNKGEGLVKLCKVIGIDIDETIAVGDAENDLPVFKKAGLSIAMGNAQQKIKDEADFVVSDNEHGGCVEAVNQYLLKGIS